MSYHYLISVFIPCILGGKSFIVFFFKCFFFFGRFLYSVHFPIPPSPFVFPLLLIPTSGFRRYEAFRPWRYCRRLLVLLLFSKLHLWRTKPFNSNMNSAVCLADEWGGRGVGGVGCRVAMGQGNLCGLPLELVPLNAGHVPNKLPPTALHCPRPFCPSCRFLSLPPSCPSVPFLFQPSLSLISLV